MSTMSGGSSSPEFEKLIQLATFVQGTGYLDRVKELRDLEESSKKALEEANIAIAEAKAAQEQLGQREVAIKKKEAKLAEDRKVHDARVAGLSRALGEYR